LRSPSEKIGKRVKPILLYPRFRKRVGVWGGFRQGPGKKTKIPLLPNKKSPSQKTWNVFGKITKEKKGSLVTKKKGRL